MHTFYRNQNPSERLARLNSVADKVNDAVTRVSVLEQSGVPDGGAPTPAYDPGDLTVYFENGAT